MGICNPNMENQLEKHMDNEMETWVSNQRQAEGLGLKVYPAKPKPETLNPVPLNSAALGW